MPNWCTNVVTIIGSEEKVSMFKNKARCRRQYFGDSFEDKPWNLNQPKSPEDMDVINLSFNGIVPLPDYVKKSDYDPVGYNAEREFWGCKWGASDSVIEEHNENRITYKFQTPWNPAIKFWTTASELYPDLHFFLSSYEEQGQVCRIYFHNGMGESVKGETQNFTWEWFDYDHTLPEDCTSEEEDQFYDEKYDAKVVWSDNYLGPGHHEWVLVNTIKRKLTWKSFGS